MTDDTAQHDHKIEPFAALSTDDPGSGMQPLFQLWAARAARCEPCAERWTRAVLDGHIGLLYAAVFSAYQIMGGVQYQIGNMGEAMGKVVTLINDHRPDPSMAEMDISMAEPEARAEILESAMSVLAAATLIVAPTSAEAAMSRRRAAREAALTDRSEIEAGETHTE